MKLKSATLLAAIGVSMHFILLLWRTLWRTLSMGHINYMYIAQSAVLYVPLIIFFTTLYRKQQ